MALDANEQAAARHQPTQRRRLPGCHAAIPGTLQRRFLSTGGIIENHHAHSTRITRRTYPPILCQASLPGTITVPWRGGPRNLP